MSFKFESTELQSVNHVSFKLIDTVVSCQVNYVRKTPDMMLEMDWESKLESGVFIYLFNLNLA